MEKRKRIEILNDLKSGDIIALKEDPEDDMPAIPEVEFVAYDNKYDIISLVDEDGVFEVDGEQFDKVVRRVQ